MTAKVRPDVKLTDLILPTRPEGWVPKDTWPDKSRNAKKLGRIPFGYIVDPEDEYKLIPDLNLIFILEKALDYLDLNHSLRDVCNWLLIETKLDVTHAGLNFIWKKHRAAKPSPRTTRLKAQAMGMGNYKELKIRLKRTRKIRDIKTSLTQRQKKLEKLETEAKRKEELKSKANSKYTENIRFDFEPVEEIEKEKDIIFKPNDGPQATFLSATERQVLYGGPLTLDTKVVTPTGYKELGDLDIGDYVFTPKGTQTKIIDIPFKGSEESYEITFEDGTKITASEGHKWRVTTGDWRKTLNKFRTRITKDLLDFKLSRNRNKYFVQITDPVQFEEVNHYIDPYVLGAMLGDGCITSRETMSLTNVDQDLFELFDSRLPEDYSLTHYNNSIQARITKKIGKTGGNSKNLVWEEFKRLNLSGKRSYTKFIPTEYLYDSVHNRTELLRGMMDTDGTVRNRYDDRASPELKYTTVSERLKDDFIFLCESLGFTTTYWTETIPTGIVYRVMLNGKINPFNLKRKSERFLSFKPRCNYKAIVDIKPVGKKLVQCITVEDKDHLFLVDRFTPTHNSAGGGKTYAMLADPMRWFGNKEFQGLLIRRTNDELREIKWKSNELYQRGFNARWSEKNNLWTFPSGAKMWFTYLDRDEDVLRFQGQSFTWIGIDELTQYSTPFALNYLSSRLRSTDPELSANLAMRFTTNPGGPGHHWVKKMFIDPAPAGKAFPATDLDTGEPMLHPRTGKPLFYRRFIPASLYDNPYLMQDSNYESALLSLPEDQRRKLLDGDWSVSEGAAFPEFSAKKHVIEPFEVPDNWKRFRAADYGYSSASCVLWFAIDPATSKLYVYDELYVSKKTGEELADLVLQKEYGHNVSYGVLDSSLWHQRGSPGPSIAEVMIQRGCRWRPSDRSAGSRISGKNRLHELLKTDEFGVPDIIFFNNCRKIIADLQVIPSDPRGTDDIDDRFAEDHAYDALRYGIMSRPKAQDPFSFINKDKKWQPVDPIFGY